MIAVQGRTLVVSKQRDAHSHLAHPHPFNSTVQWSTADEDLDVSLGGVVCLHTQIHTVKMGFIILQAPEFDSMPPYGELLHSD